jgi:molecular chaperone DnaK
MKYSGSERRQHSRMPIAMQVRYRSLEAFFYDYAVNISHGGIFIKTRKPLARGAEVELEFEAPGASKKFKSRGQVVRVIFPGEDEMEPAGMGIEFEPLSAEDKAMIDRLWQKSAAAPKHQELTPP